MEIIKGRRQLITVPITQAGAIMNLTGYQAKLVLALQPGGTPVLTKAGIISAPETGYITFSLLPAETAPLLATDYKAEVNIWKTADLTLIYSPVTFIAEIKEGITATPTA